MALSVFGKVLSQRPAPRTPRTLTPIAGSGVLNKLPTLTRPLAAKAPIASYANRAFHPAPGAPTSAAPDKFVHRAIRNVLATVRKPDRGAAIVLQGAALTMPDGTVGGSPVTPAPIRNPLAQVFDKIVSSGGNVNLRQTQIGTIARESYLDRQRNRDVTASVGKMVRGGLIQRRGYAFIGKPFPSTLGALDKAKLWRTKPGTPTGVQGDRALNYPTAHVGAVYTKTVAPLETSEQFIAARVGGTGTAAAPIPSNGGVVLANPSLTTQQSVGRAYAWASPDTDAGSTPSSTGTMNLGESAERWGLLVGVAVLAFILIRKS